MMLTLLSATLLLHGATLQVDVRGVTAPGALHIALYTPAEPFASVQTTFRGIIIDRSPYTAHFDTLPTGRYAVALFQDRNGNGELDTNFFGVPVEPYGFSNNVRPRFFQPGFDACSFDLNATQRIEIRLID